MRCSHCQKCCQDTKMELCKADISRLERRGHLADDFCEMGLDGIPRLRNDDGYCHFFDRERKRCKEYASRPLGCCIYPVNMDEDGELVLDELCPEADTMTKDEMMEKGKRLGRLLATIDSEAAARIERHI
jgi:uncharacterized protein